MLDDNEFWLSSVESEGGSEDKEIAIHDVLKNCFVINVSTHQLLGNSYLKLSKAVYYIDDAMNCVK